MTKTKDVKARAEELRWQIEGIIADQKSGRPMKAADHDELDRLVTDYQGLVGDVLGQLKSEIAGKKLEAADRESMPKVNPYWEGESKGGGAGDKALAELGGLMTKALGESSGAGAFIVPPQFLGRMWDRLAAESVAIQSGITVIDVTSDEVHLPRRVADPAAAWLSEAQAITPTDPDYNELVLRPKKLGALTVLSNELLADSNPQVRGLVITEITRSMGLKLDDGIYEGSGTPPEITGLKNTSGVQVVSMGTNGASPTNLDAWADALGLLAEANARGPVAIVMHPRTWRTLSKIKEVSGSTKPVLQEEAGGPTAAMRRTIYGIPVFLTSQLAIDETQGTATNASSSYVYVAPEVILARRSDFRVEFNAARLFNSDQSELRGIGRFDVGLPNPAAVVRILGLLP